MKKMIVGVIVAILLLLLFFFFYSKGYSKTPSTVKIATVARQTSIVWIDDFADAKKMAKKENKTLVLFFTGSDWCPWCKRMQGQFLDNDTFQKKVAPYFIFHEVDFPSKQCLSADKQQENNALKKQYGVRGFPMLILLDPEEDVIATMGYQNISAEEYADEMLSKIKKKSFEELSVKELKGLHEIAKNKGHNHFVAKICAFCHGKAECLEKYAHLLEQNESLDAIAKLKGEIKQNDLHNVHKWNLQLALIDFAHLVKKQVALEEAVEPLLDYIREFGMKDTEAHWRLEMFLSNYFLLHQKHHEALCHARNAFRVAPVGLKQEITEAIVALRQQSNKESASLQKGFPGSNF